MITLIINMLKGMHVITGDKYDKALLLEFIKALREKGLSTDEVLSAIKELYF